MLFNQSQERAKIKKDEKISQKKATKTKLNVSGYGQAGFFLTLCFIMLLYQSEEKSKQKKNKTDISRYGQAGLCLWRLLWFYRSTSLLLSSLIDTAHLNIPLSCP